MNYMLDTCICSYIMREHPESVMSRPAEALQKNNRIVISAVTYAEMRYGQIGKKASAKHKVWIDSFVARLDAILPWDMNAIDATIEIRHLLAKAGTPIGANDAAIAGHAISAKCTLVTNNIREFSRVPSLQFEDWVS